MDLILGNEYYLQEKRHATFLRIKGVHFQLVHTDKICSVHPGQIKYIVLTTKYLIIVELADWRWNRCSGSIYSDYCAFIILK